MKWNVGMKIAAAFGLALAMLAVVGAVSYRNTAVLIDTSELVAHTHQVLEKLEALLSTMKDAETGQRGYVITGEERYLEPYRGAQLAVGQDIKALRALTVDNANRQRRLDAIEAVADAKFTELQAAIDLRKDKGFDAAAALILTDKGKKLMDDLRKVIDDMASEENTLLKTRADEAQSAARNTTLTIALGTIAAIIVMAVLGLAITRNIGRPLQALTGAVERITVGDLDVNIATDARSDEVGVLARTFARMTHSLRAMAAVAEQIADGDLRTSVKPQSPNDMLGNAFARMVDNLRAQLRELIDGTGVLGAAASEIVTSTTQLAASASESAAAVTQTTTTVEEVRQTAQLGSQKAKQVSDSAQRTAQISQSGRKSAEDVAAGILRIRQQMEAIAASMVRLSEQSQAIGQIMAVVEDLATQSNLLAVNAAIEAAKAGEHGKGFGVVAQEVKSLAEQSRQATNQVRSILGDIQKATTAAVLATEQGGKAVEAGAQQTEVASASIQTLAGSVAEAAQAATQIAASGQQQLVGVDQVATAMESIRQASTQNMASARQLEAAARNLSDLGHRLKQMVERYRV